MTPAIAPSNTVENYLKCIYLQELQREGKLVSTGQIATELQVAPGTATTMAKNLAEGGLVIYEPYSGVRLTAEGTRIASHVIRRHRVVELFLVEIMGMDWSKVHTDAELLEHAVSDRLIDRMDEMLGRPQVDPHGDPIPSATGTIDATVYPSLLTCPLATPREVVRVIDQRSEFLRLIETRRLMPGDIVTVVGRDEEADTVTVNTRKGAPLSLGFRAASKILVKSDE